MTRLPFSLLLTLLYTIIFSEEKSLGIRTLISPAIRLDGRLDEATWENAEAITGFAGHYPQDTALAANQTEVHVFRDDKNLYVGAVCRMPVKGKLVVQSLRRDFEAYDDESFGIVLNPTGEGGDGFWFAVNAWGAQTDALLAGGGSGYSVEWDAPWSAATFRSDSLWTVEIAIPLKVLRGGKDKAWKGNFFRTDTRGNESSTWVRVPREQIAASTAFNGTLAFDKAPPPAARRPDWNPYIAATANRSGDSTNNFWKRDFKAGLDVRLPLTASLQLDATLNPDFSYVDADEPVTDLSRFAQSVPEQRPFFLENAQMFSGFAKGDAQPFFSRRIGLNGARPVPIAAGAKVSGSLGGRWKLGFLDAHTASVPADSLAAQNYSMLSFQRGIFALSDASVFLVNRQAFDGANPEYDDYNRVAGANLNLRAKDGGSGFSAHHHQSFSPTPSERPFHSHAEAWSESDRIYAMLEADYVGRDYNPETGFAPRPGVLKLKSENYLTFYPVLPFVNSTAIGGPATLWLDDALWAFSESQVSPEFSVSFKDKGYAKLYYNWTQVRLTEPYDAGESGGTPLPAGDYGYAYVGASYSSSTLYPVGAYAHAAHGGYYTGEKTSVDGELRLRIGPWMRLTTYYAGHFIDLPAPSGRSSLHLTGGTADLSLSTRSSFTTFVRHDPQENTTRLTFRFQYRYAQLSDIYLVYGDLIPWGISVPAERGFAARINRWF